MRTLTAEMKSALRSAVIRPSLLIEFVDPSGATARAWSGQGPLKYAGNTYLGAGLLLAISPVQSTANVVVQEIQVTLAGVPEDALFEADDVDVKKVICNAYWAALTEDRQVIPDPILIVRARGDTLTDRVENDGSVSIIFTAHAGFWNLDRAQNRAWTSEEQKKTYPDDTGFDLIPGYQNKEFVWTRT